MQQPDRSSGGCHSMPMPNFLIIGAAKSGTTSLHKYLSQHPQIYMSPMKEPNFFAYENLPQPKFRGLDEDTMILKKGPIRRRDSTKYSFVITRLSDYQKLFSKVRLEKAVGESSPLYLYNPQAVERIKHYTPEIRLIAILRNPVDRAYSHFKFFQKEGHETIMDFGQALKMEHVRMQRNWTPGWFYKQRGFYYQQLKKYYERFDRSQIRVYLHDNFHSSPISILQDIFRFLGVDETFTPDLEKRFNVSNGPVYGPKNYALDNFLNSPNFVKSIIKTIFPITFLRLLKAGVEKLNVGREYQFVVQPISEDIRKQLQNEYREDILKLQELIGQDLSRWLH
jgi:hypothetical protein